MAVAKSLSSSGFFIMADFKIVNLSSVGLRRLLMASSSGPKAFNLAWSWCWWAIRSSSWFLFFWSLIHVRLLHQINGGFHLRAVGGNRCGEKNSNGDCQSKKQLFVQHSLGVKHRILQIFTVLKNNTLGSVFLSFIVVSFASTLKLSWAACLLKRNLCPWGIRIFSWSPAQIGLVANDNGLPARSDALYYGNCWLLKLKELPLFSKSKLSLSSASFSTGRDTLYSPMSVLTLFGCKINTATCCR